MGVNIRPWRPGDQVTVLVDALVLRTEMAGVVVELTGEVMALPTSEGEVQVLLQNSFEGIALVSAAPSTADFVGAIKVGPQGDGWVHTLVDGVRGWRLPGGSQTLDDAAVADWPVVGAVFGSPAYSHWQAEQARGDS